jgi:hypothetical protein
MEIAMNLQPLPPPRVDAAGVPIVPSRDRLLTAILTLDGAIRRLAWRLSGARTTPVRRHYPYY